jgi:hypothetical protein
MRNVLQVAMSLEADALVTKLDRLAETDRDVNAVLVAHLAALEARGLHLDLGYSSLFTYATERLKMAEEVAYKRIRAARIARRFPEVLDMLATGGLNLSTLVLLAPELCKAPGEGFSRN